MSDAALSRRSSKERIVDAARTLLRETGTLKMRSLADAAGVAHMTPYNVCGSKNDVLAAISEAQIEHMTRKLVKKGFSSGLDFIFASLDQALADFSADPAFFKALYKETYRSGDRLSLERFQTSRILFWNKALVRCKKEGIFSASLPNESLTQALMYLFSGSVTRWIHDQINIEEMFAEVNVLFLSLLVAQAEPSSRKALEDRISHWSRRLPANAPDG